jgi:hypothetical protein
MIPERRQALAAKEKGQGERPGVVRRESRLTPMPHLNSLKAHPAMACTLPYAHYPGGISPEGDRTLPLWVSSLRAGSLVGAKAPACEASASSTWPPDRLGDRVPGFGVNRRGERCRCRRTNSPSSMDAEGCEGRNSDPQTHYLALPSRSDLDWGSYLPPILLCRVAHKVLCGIGGHIGSETRSRLRRRDKMLDWGGLPAQPRRVAVRNKPGERGLPHPGIPGPRCPCFGPPPARSVTCALRL